MAGNIDLSKSLPHKRWTGFFDQFSDANRGRHISIEIIDSELGDEELIQNAPLIAMIYEHPGKGDDLLLEVGRSQVTYAHTLNSPTEVLTGQNPNGEIVAIWITDAAGSQTLIVLQAN